MNLELTDRVAFVAGSSRGIGKAVAFALAREGARVVLTGRDAETLARTADDLGSVAGPDNVLALRGDLTETTFIQHALADTVTRFGALDVVCANVGSGRGRPDWDLDDDEWTDFLRVNLLGSVRVVRAAVPYLKKSPAPAVVFTSSIAGIESLGAPIGYESAKAAVIAAAKNLARSLAPLGIRVNVVAPGNVLFEGSAWADKMTADRTDTLRIIESGVPMQRFGTPDEIADAVTFLVSARASFITGACLVVDGGQTRSS